MKKMRVLALLLVVTTMSYGNDIDKKVEDILGKMSIEEKVGQMTQINVDLIMVGEPFALEEPNKIDPEKVKKIIEEYKVGSILNCGGHTWERSFWYEIHKALDKARGDIPVLYGVDAIHGVNYTVGGTLFPQQLGQAATWNPELVEEAARITAYETRASGIPWNFSPVLDVGRQPLWSRFFETFGEDVFLAKTLGDAMVRGYQGDDVSDKERVAACLKHFYGYSLPFSGKDRTPVYLGEIQLREYFLPTFQSAIDQGAKTIMINSGEINGIPVHASKEILTDLLRTEMGFDGVALTDWEDIIKLYNIHRVAEDHKDAIRIAINAGVDMSMVPLTTEFCDLLLELVEEGKVTEERIDQSVRRILKLKYELGLFDQAYYPLKDYKDFASEAHAEAALLTAEESITLLKNNDNILPLSKESKVLVTGPAAHSLNILNGAWTHTWQGDDAKYNTPGKQTIWEALRAANSENIFYSEGSSLDELVNLDETVEKAKSSDVILVCLGEDPTTEKPGDITDLNLPQAQKDLVHALAETGKPIVFVLVFDRPRVIQDIEPHADAVLMAYLPGDEGGRAISNILYGDVNPSGKLPFTYPKHVNDLVLYDRKHSEDQDTKFGTDAFNPQFEFGAGMSYTTFVYSGLSISQESMGLGDDFEISVQVTNTGKRSGKEVVQLYVTDLVASVTPCVKRLRAFDKIELAPGEKRVVTFSLNTADLSFVNKDLDWVTEPGNFTFEIGGSTGEFEVR